MIHFLTPEVISLQSYRSDNLLSKSSRLVVHIRRIQNIQHSSEDVAFEIPGSQKKKDNVPNRSEFININRTYRETSDFKQWPFFLYEHSCRLLLRIFRCHVWLHENEKCRGSLRRKCCSLGLNLRKLGLNWLQS